ncbi:MAG: replication-associated recombination protein A, partial [Mycobacteriales bacterium]
MAQTLFDAAAREAAERAAPLAVRLRPAAFAELLGQDHLLAEGSPLRLLAAGGRAPSL